MPSASTSPAYTPGPWKTEAYGEYIAIYGADGCRIADVYAAPTVDDDDEARAVARLIASAPTLVEQLQTIVDMARSVAANWDNGNDLASAVRRLQRVADESEAIVAQAENLLP